MLSNVKVIAVVIVIIVLLGGSFALAFAHWEAGAIVAFVTALVAVVTPILVNVYKTDRQSEVLATIDEHTNSALDRRIQAAVSRGIDTHLARMADALEQRRKNPS